MKNTLLKSKIINYGKTYRSPMQKRLCSLLVLFLSGIQMHAQVSIRGMVSNSRKEPVCNVNIFLHTKSDSLLIKTTSTDANGRFAFFSVPKGSYHLSASGIGYNRMLVLIDNAQQDIHSLQLVLTEKTEELDEIIVSSSRVINEFDRQIHFPDDFEKKHSSGGIELIDKMSLSSVIVNKSDNSITGIHGGNIQLRINGAPAEAIDVQSIDPKLVTRIEYHDMPSMRYSDAEAVIDFYVKNRESGGNLKLFTFNSFQTEWRTGTASLKMNHRKSEFAFRGWYSKANFKEIYSTKREVLNFGDDEMLFRTSWGLPARSHETTYNIGTSYSYFVPDNISFLAKVSYSYFSFPVHIAKSQIFLNELPESSMNQLDSSTYKDRRPVFNLYFQKKWKNRQLFAFDIVASYFDTATFDWYLESQDNNIITEIFSEVNGSKYSVIAEAIYEKGLKKGKIGLGAKQSLNFVNSGYKGSMDYESSVKLHVTDFHAEWSTNIDKFNYGINVGGRLQQYIQNTKSSVLMLKASLRLGYQLNRMTQLRYQGSLLVETPSPGDLNVVRQEKDSYRIKSGNPELKSATNYNNVLNLSYNQNSLSSNLGVNYIFTVNPMLKNTFREDKKFISQIQNGKELHKVYVTGHFRYSLFQRRLSAYVRGGYRFMQNSTEDYLHSLNNWHINSGISGTYKHFTLYGDIKTRMNILTGERILYREQSACVGVDCQWKELKVGGLMCWNLGSYSSRTVELNRYLSSNSYRYMPETQAWFKLRLSWNLNFGMQRDSNYKRIENSDEDNGLLK